MASKEVNMIKINDDTVLNSLLYADDQVLWSDSEDGSQMALHSLM